MEGVRSIDANLLLALHALLEERNLTHAGARLMVSQPAMSGALARLRRHFGDELLVRAGREYQLTPLAEKLRPVVTEAVASAERVFGSAPTFDPASTHRTFAVSLTEYAMIELAPPLVRLLSERAPYIDVEFTQIPTDTNELSLQLLRRDLIIGPAGFGIPGRRQPVFSDQFVCVVGTDNVRLRNGALQLDDLQAMPHAVARFGPGQTTNTPDAVALAEAGVERDVRVVVPSLLTLPTAVAGTQLCAFVPRRLARRYALLLDLVIARTPLPPIPLVEVAHWHPSRVGDPALSWLRSQLHDVAVTIEDD